MNKYDVHRCADALLAAANEAPGEATWIRSLRVCALAAQRIASANTSAETALTRDIRRQLLPLGAPVTAPLESEVRCAYWAFHLYASLGRDMARRPDVEEPANGPELDPARASKIKTSISGIRDDLATLRSDTQSAKLKAAIDDADLASQWVQLVCDGVPALKIVSRALVLLLKTLRRVRELLPKRTRERVDAWLEKTRVAIGIVEVAEAEENVRQLILQDKKPPGVLRRKVRHLTFADIEGARWIADPLTSLDLVATCENLESLWIAGTLVKDLTPLLKCPRLRDVDVEATEVESIAVLVSKDLPNMHEIFWGSTPAESRRDDLVFGNRANLFPAPNSQREVVRAVAKTKARGP